MPVIDMTEYDLESSQEPHAMKGGEEYRLTIISVSTGTDKNNHAYVLPRLEVVGEPFAKDFTHFLHLPDDTMGAKQLNRVKYELKSFCAAFEIDTSRLADPVDLWPGHEGYAILGIEKDERYGEQNFISKLMTPK